MMKLFSVTDSHTQSNGTQPLIVSSTLAGSRRSIFRTHQRNSNSPIRRLSPAVPGTVSLFVLMVTAVLTYSETPLSVSDAVAEGLEHNYRIRIARIDEARAQNNRVRKPGGILPRISVGTEIRSTRTEYAEPRQPPLPQSVDETAVTASGSIQWTVFDGFRMFHAWNLVEQEARSTELQSRHALESAVVALITAFYDVAAAQQLHQAAAVQCSVSSAQLTRLQKQLQYGRVDTRVSLAQRVALNSDSSALLNRTAELTRARQTLNISLGREPTDPVIIVTDTTSHPPSHSAEYWFESARKHNAQLAISTIQTHIAASSAGIARSAFWPRIALSGSLAYSPYETDYTRSSAAVSLTWPILNGFETMVSARNSTLQQQSAQIGRERQVAELKHLVYTQWEALNHAWQGVVFGKTALATAEQSLRTSEQHYALGRISNIEYREAQLARLQAAIQLETARYRCRVLHSQLQQLAGSLSLPPPTSR